MKYTKFLLIPVLALSLVLSTGCANRPKPVSQTVAEANARVSSYTVQAAEHSLRAAKDSFDLFFTLVHENHDFVVSNLPEVYAFALRMQVQAPAALKKANAVKNAFKYNRNAQNQADLNTAMATIVRYMTEVQAQTRAIQSSTP